MTCDDANPYKENPGLTIGNINFESVYVPAEDMPWRPVAPWPKKADEAKDMDSIIKQIKEANEKAAAKAKDNVNSPKHYNHNEHGIECIQAIQASMSKEEFQGYLKGNCIKYLWRYKYKNGLEDLNKAQWYSNKLIEVTKNV